MENANNSFPFPVVGIGKASELQGVRSARFVQGFATGNSVV